MQLSITPIPVERTGVQAHRKEFSDLGEFGFRKCYVVNCLAVAIASIGVPSDRPPPPPARPTCVVQQDAMVATCFATQF